MAALTPSFLLEMFAFASSQVMKQIMPGQGVTSRAESFASSQFWWAAVRTQEPSREGIEEAQKHWIKTHRAPDLRLGVSQRIPWAVQSMQSQTQTRLTAFPFCYQNPEQTKAEKDGSLSGGPLMGMNGEAVSFCQLQRIFVPLGDILLKLFKKWMLSRLSATMTYMTIKIVRW